MLISDDPEVLGITSRFNSEISNCLIKTNLKLINRKADYELGQWFGKVSENNFQITVKHNMNLFLNNFNSKQVIIKFLHPDEDVNFNIGKALNSRLYTSDLENPVDDNRKFDRCEIRLGRSFRTLPDYLPRLGNGEINMYGHEQSKLQALLHELSHVLIGTSDIERGGERVYGTRSAKRLAEFSHKKAINNADNWSIFIEACGSFQNHR